MSLLNPMNVGAPGNPYQQPSSGNPAPNPSIASFPTGANSMALTWPIVPPPQQDSLFPSQATMLNDPNNVHSHTVT